MHSLVSLVLAVVITGTAGAPVASKPMTERIKQEKLVMAQHRIEPAPEPQTFLAASDTPPATPPNRWDVLAQCESNGDWHINTGNGYYGGLQFNLSSWQWVGGEGYPHQASREEQIARAEILLERQGWSAWPACSRKLGWR